MKMKLVKIVYDYSIERDAIQAKHFFEAAEPGEPVDMETPNGEDRASYMQDYTRKEWDDMVYKLGAHRPHVVVRKAMEELIRA